MDYELFGNSPQTASIIRDIVLGGDDSPLAPTKSLIPRPRPEGLGVRDIDTQPALDEALANAVGENLRRSTLPEARQRVVDAVIPVATNLQQPVSTDWDRMVDVNTFLSTSQAIPTLPSSRTTGLTMSTQTATAPEMPEVDPVAAEGSTRGATPVSQKQEDQPESETVTDDGFRPPEFYAENLNDTQSAIYENALNGAREAGLSGVELAQYMAQLGHESDNFRTAEEYASGAAYEGRKDLGNTQPGDGRRYKGRGYIQLTGRANYQAAGDALGIDLINNPDLASSDPAIASAVSIWYWQNRVQPEVEDFSDTRTVTRIINGGYNGLEDRMTKFEQFTGGGDRGFTDLAPSDSLVPRPRPNRQE